MNANSKWIWFHVTSKNRKWETLRVGPLSRKKWFWKRDHLTCPEYRYHHSQLNWKNPLDIAPIKIRSKENFRLKFNAANFGQKSYHEFSSTSFNFSLHILDFKIQFQNLKSKKWPPFIYQYSIMEVLDITVLGITKGFLNWKMNWWTYSGKMNFVLHWP